MANTNIYYNRAADYNPDEVADGDSVEAEFDAIQRGFESVSTDKQDASEKLTALVNMTWSANKLPYFSGANTCALTPISAFIRTLMSNTDASTALSTLGGLANSGSNLSGGAYTLTQSGNGPLLRTGFPDTTTAGLLWGSTSVPHMSISSTTNGAAFSIVRYSADATGPSLNFGKSRSPAVATRSPTLSGDALGNINFSGCLTTETDTAGVGNSGLMQYKASQNWSDTAMGGYFSWHTTPNDSVIRSEAMRLTGDNELLINTNYARSLNGGEKLSVNGNSYATGYVESGSELRACRVSASSYPALTLANGYWGGTTLPSAAQTVGSIRFMAKSATADAYGGKFVSDVFAQMQSDGSGTLTGRAMDASAITKTYYRLFGDKQKMTINTVTDDGLGSVLQVNGTAAATSPAAGDNSKLLATTEWVNARLEEGTFTPVAYGATSAGAGTYTSQAGRYKKISDKLVQVDIGISWSAHTGTGNLMLSGLPFTCKSTNVNAVLMSGATFNGSPVAYCGSNTTTIQVRQNVSGGSYTFITIPSGATSLWCSFIYQIS